MIQLLHWPDFSIQHSRSFAMCEVVLFQRINNCGQMESSKLYCNSHTQTNAKRDTLTRLLVRSLAHTYILQFIQCVCVNGTH